jgi:hypothetical protein
MSVNPKLLPNAAPVNVEPLAGAQANSALKKADSATAIAAAANECFRPSSANSDEPVANRDPASWAE